MTMSSLSCLRNILEPKGVSGITVWALAHFRLRPSPRDIAETQNCRRHSSELCYLPTYLSPAARRRGGARSSSARLCGGKLAAWRPLPATTLLAAFPCCSSSCKAARSSVPADARWKDSLRCSVLAGPMYGARCSTMHGESVADARGRGARARQLHHRLSARVLAALPGSSCSPCSPDDGARCSRSCSPCSSTARLLGVREAARRYGGAWGARYHARLPLACTKLGCSPAIFTARQPLHLLGVRWVLLFHACIQSTREGSRLCIYSINIYIIYVY
ncbi:hypothetical protein Dimus_038616 [Dionaea muscipula]